MRVCSFCNVSTKTSWDERGALMSRLKMITLAKFIKSLRNTFVWKLCPPSSGHTSLKASQMSRCESGHGYGHLWRFFVLACASYSFLWKLIFFPLQISLGKVSSIGKYAWGLLNHRVSVLMPGVGGRYNWEGSRKCALPSNCSENAVVQSLPCIIEWERMLQLVPLI